MGSVSGTGANAYYPYGEEQVTSANDVDTFRTYYRDGTTGLGAGMGTDLFGTGRAIAVSASLS